MRTIIVANRLPMTITIAGDELSVTQSAGGVATGLGSLGDVTRVGWPGADVPQRLQRKATELLQEQHTTPVFLRQKLVDQFYNGFCNKTLWPLCHYFPSLVSYDDEQYAAYVETNRLFCDALKGIVQPGDFVWIHDYHLMLLPAMLREEFPDLRIGFFLHIPFPTFEIFQLLPQRWREALLRGVLGADVVGFHTYDYTQHFLKCALRMLGLEHRMGMLQVKDRYVKVDTFPISIDFERFHAGDDDAAVRKVGHELKTEGMKTILSMDRLDYSKGIPQRLLAYERFLDEHPQWREQVVMLAVVVPSRLNVDSYQKMKKQLDELVGRINGRFATLAWTPIIYQYRSLEFDELLAYYRLSDVALLTPLRDGMNLIAKEYVASRRDRSGVLILSEMAGAAKELGEALLINPNDLGSASEAILHALEMPLAEQQRRNAIMQERIRRYDITRWTEEFMAAVQDMRVQEQELRTRLISAPEQARIIQAYTSAKRRLLLLDYDGTLVDLAPRPALAAPDDALLDLLRRVARSADVMIVSGRDHQTMDAWFSDLGVGMIAEHGGRIKKDGHRAGEDGWTVDPTLHAAWKKDIYPVLERHVDRLPGAFIEEKEFSLAYHYRMADPELGSVRTKELLDALTNLTAHMPVNVLQGSKVIEVRCSGVDKGTATLRLIDEYDFVLAIGDDWTDEELFRSMPGRVHTIRVGSLSSHAQYSMKGVAEVRRLLEEFAKIPAAGAGTASLQRAQNVQSARIAAVAKKRYREDAGADRSAVRKTGKK